MLLAAFTAAPASAYFGGGAGSATAAATVGVLPATTVTATAGAGTVALSWTAVSAPVGATVTYYVTRAGGTVGGTCPSSAAGATTSTTCTDSGLSKGSYSYTVTATPQQVGTTGQRMFYSDQTGTIRFDPTGAGASATSTPLK